MRKWCAAGMAGLVVAVLFVASVKRGLCDGTEGDQGTASVAVAPVAADAATAPETKTTEGEAPATVEALPAEASPAAAEAAPAGKTEDLPVVAPAEPAAEKPADSPQAAAAAEATPKVEELPVAPVKEEAKAAAAPAEAPAPVVAAPATPAEVAPAPVVVPAAAKEPAVSLASAATPSPVAAVPVGAVTGNSGHAPGDTAGLMATLRKREAELSQAKAEVTRLKGLIKEIWAANKREKLTMYYNLGCIYKSSGAPKKAESCFLAALGLDASDAGTHYNLGVLYDDDLKDKRKAKIHYERFLELAPNDKDAPRVREWLSSMM